MPFPVPIAVTGLGVVSGFVDAVRRIGAADGPARATVAGRARGGAVASPTVVRA